MEIWNGGKLAYTWLLGCSIILLMPYKYLDTTTTWLLDRNEACYDLAAAICPRQNSSRLYVTFLVLVNPPQEQDKKPYLGNQAQVCDVRFDHIPSSIIGPSLGLSPDIGEKSRNHVSRIKVSK